MNSLTIPRSKACISVTVDLRAKLAAFIDANRADLQICDIEGYLADALGDLDHEIGQESEAGYAAAADREANANRAHFTRNAV